MQSEALKDKIYSILNSTKGDAESARQTIECFTESELFIWLGEQDNSVLYHLALDLDIPLQHLNNTCKTMKQISQIFV
jgi:hypothetical protein